MRWPILPVFLSSIALAAPQTTPEWQRQVGIEHLGWLGGYGSFE